MPKTGLGVALRTLRERSGNSLRNITELSGVDHAYIYRLETGEKTNPSLELVEKVLGVLSTSPRENALVAWLVEHPDADHALVQHALQDPTVDVEIFSAAAGVRHRGTARPDPATLIARVKLLFAEDQDEDN